MAAEVQLIDSPIVYAICVKCGHPVAEHQPAWGSPGRSGHTGTYGCSICDCQLTENEKMRAWGGG